MEITESLSNDIKIAPEWFHSSVSIEPRQENLKQPLGNLNIKFGIERMQKIFLY